MERHHYDGMYKIQEALFKAGLHENLITLAHLSYFPTKLAHLSYFLTVKIPIQPVKVMIMLP